MFQSDQRIIAAEYLPPFTPVTYNGRRADSRLLVNKWRIAGFTGAQGAQKGYAIQAITTGEITFDHFTGPLWTPNELVYLDGVQFSQTVPSEGFIQILGVAKANNTLFVELSEPQPLESLIETRTDDPVNPAVGRIWLRTDL